MWHLFFTWRLGAQLRLGGFYESTAVRSFDNESPVDLGLFGLWEKRRGEGVIPWVVCGVKHEMIVAS